MVTPSRYIYTTIDGARCTIMASLEDVRLVKMNEQLPGRAAFSLCLSPTKRY